MTESGRQVSMELDLDATLEDAWRALTDARELTRWFPVSATVEGRPGGAMVWDWGEKFHWATRIDVWDPPHRLRLVQDVERPFDIDGKPLADGSISSGAIAIEFALETHRGKTRLRLVHSGFGEGAAWDDELEGVRNGWAFELRGLRHYLARHLGKDRFFGWANRSTGASHSAVWRALLGPGGYEIEAADLAAGQPFAVCTPDGTRLTGTLVLHLPERELVGTVRELDDGVFRLATWSAHGDVGVTVWAATWSPAHQRDVHSLGAAGQGFLDRVLPTAAQPATPTERT